jgi:hypothetical protein
MSELQNLNIEEHTADIPNINEFSLYDKCEIRIQELNDEHDLSKATSKTAQLLRTIYDLNDRIEMKKVIFY